jgi:uncharacterized RDD family membrane protein YckC
MVQMPKILDVITKDKQIQDHWVRRLIAFIIDAIVVAIVYTIIYFSILFWLDLFCFGGAFIWFTGGLLFGILFILYGAFMEGTRSATIGKDVMKLKVECTERPMDFVKGLVRNLSKIHYLLLILDIILTLISEGDPYQRYFDKIANTVVKDMRPRPRKFPYG